MKPTLFTLVAIILALFVGSLCVAGLLILSNQNKPRQFELYLVDVKTHQRDTLMLPWMWLDSVNDKDDVLLHNRLPVPCMCMKDTGEYQLMHIVDMHSSD